MKKTCSIPDTRKHRIKIDYTKEDIEIREPNDDEAGDTYAKRLSHAIIFFIIISLPAFVLIDLFLRYSFDSGVIFFYSYVLSVFFWGVLTIRFDSVNNFINKLTSQHEARYECSFTNSKDKVIEIPMFQNYVLDYEAFGEFSKYFETLEIIPHSFNYTSNLKHKGKKPEPFDMLWKAVFTFSQPPKSGELKVRFK